MQQTAGLRALARVRVTWGFWEGLGLWRFCGGGCGDFVGRGAAEEESAVECDSVYSWWNCWTDYEDDWYSVGSVLGE